MINAHEFEQRLAQLDPDAVQFPLQIDGLLELVEPSNHESFIPAIFRFFELHAYEYAGAPGTLVHFVEAYYPDYKPILVASLKKTPSKSAVLMVNRILNGNVSQMERTEYLGILESIARNPKLDASISSTAEKFIEHQRKRAQQ